MALLRKNQPAVNDRHPLAQAQVRVWFWNNAGAQHLICPLREANHIRQLLLSEGAVVWHSEIYNP